MAAEKQYIANTGMVQISTANSNLDGTGVLGTLITAPGDSNGTYIPSIFIKSITDTVEGTIRFFLFDGTTTRIINEVHVPMNTKSATNPAFEYLWNSDFTLKAGWSIKVSTQYDDTFNVFAEGLNWTYSSSPTSLRQFTANTGVGIISTANTRLDGTGTTVTVLKAGEVADGWNGCRIYSLTIKALSAVVDSIVRFYINDDSTNTRLIMEVVIPSVAQSGTQASFRTRICLDKFSLQAGYSIVASTETAQSFVVTVEGCDWKYPS